MIFNPNPLLTHFKTRTKTTLNSRFAGKPGFNIAGKHNYKHRAQIYLQPQSKRGYPFPPEQGAAHSASGSAADCSGLAVASAHKHLLALLERSDIFQAARPRNGASSRAGRDGREHGPRRPNTNETNLNSGATSLGARGVRGRTYVGVV